MNSETAAVEALSGVDHVGITVRNLETAVREVTELLSGHLCYVEGPIVDRGTGWMSAKLGARGECTLHVAALNVHGLNLELFDYTGADREDILPAPDEPGTCSLALRTPRMAALTAQLEDRAAEVVYDRQGRLFWCTLPSGLQLYCEEAREEDVLPMVTLGPTAYEHTVRDFVRRFCMASVQVAPHSRATTELTGTGGTRIILRRSAKDRKTPLTNSDIGGHHIAFHADDVETAWKAFASLEGYTVLGSPETINDGPIAGDTWVYITSPVGLQLELVNMPDGLMPYEATSLARRNPIRAGGKP